MVGFEARIKGLVFGHAVGDSVGLAGEFLTKSDIASHYGRIIDSRRLKYDPHRMQWKPGEWTDDTDHLMLTMESVSDQGRVDIHDLGGKLHRWGRESGRGMGFLTANVFTTEGFYCDPIEAAMRARNRLDKNSAPNGNLMRAAVAGVVHYDDDGSLTCSATAICKATHYDARCVASSV